MATISNTDKQYLSAEQQKQIAELKEQWAAANAANDQAGMDAAHQAAEQIRASAGYSGGSSGNAYQVNGANSGGMTAEQMKLWLDDYQSTNYTPGQGWTNGYSTAMNSRSKANKIRQQMDANSKAWHTADAEQQKYLHEQNLALAQLLYDYTGQSEDNTWYDEQTGQWKTWNKNVGYGVQQYMPGYAEDAKEYYGYTDQQLKDWANDASVYSNFVDTRAGSRGIRDESTGFTGEYAQFLNGPYLQLMTTGTHALNGNELYTNVLGDGFYDDEDLSMMTGQTPQYDADGNPILVKDRLKNNNGMDDYTRQFASYTQNGVIMPGSLVAGNGVGGTGVYSGVTGDTVDASNPLYHGGATQQPSGRDTVQDQLDYYEKYGQYSELGGYGTSAAGSTSSSGGTYQDYINQMYDAALQAQLESLKASYEQNISELDASVGKVDDTYTEQKRQTTGTNAQQAAAWREMANAYGLNSGAIGQAALAQNNQLQSNLNTLESAQAAAQAEIELQRTLLGQEYQAQINQAIAENNMNKAEMLYQEAVRADEALIQQQQYYASLALQYAQLGLQQSQYQDELALQYAKASQSSSGTGTVSEDTGITPYDYEALYRAIQQSGQDPTAWLYNKYNQTAYGYGSSDEAIEGILSGYEDWYKQQRYDYFNGVITRAENADRPGLNENDFFNLKAMLQKHNVAGHTEMYYSLLEQYADILSNAQYNELLSLIKSWE